MCASLELVNRFKTLHIDKLVNSIGYKIIFYTGITKKVCAFVYNNHLKWHAVRGTVSKLKHTSITLDLQGFIKTAQTSSYHSSSYQMLAHMLRKIILINIQHIKKSRDSRFLLTEFLLEKEHSLTFSFELWDFTLNSINFTKLKIVTFKLYRL